MAASCEKEKKKNMKDIAKDTITRIRDLKKLKKFFQSKPEGSEWDDPTYAGIPVADFEIIESLPDDDFSDDYDSFDSDSFDEDVGDDGKGSAMHSGIVGENNGPDENIYMNDAELVRLRKEEESSLERRDSVPIMEYNDLYISGRDDAQSHKKTSISGRDVAERDDFQSHEKNSISAVSCQSLESIDSQDTAKTRSEIAADGLKNAWKNMKKQLKSSPRIGDSKEDVSNISAGTASPGGGSGAVKRFSDAFENMREKFTNRLSQATSTSSLTSGHSEDREGDRLSVSASSTRDLRRNSHSPSPRGSFLDNGETTSLAGSEISEVGI